MPVSFWDNINHFAASNSSYHDESFHGMTSFTLGFNQELDPGVDCFSTFASHADSLDGLSHTFQSS